MSARRAFFWGYLVLLAFLSLNPWVGPPAGGSLLPWDKAAHAAAYGGLSVLTFMAWERAWRPRLKTALRIWLAAVLAAAAYGALMEVAQGTLTTYRDASVGDALANAAGAALGAAAGALFLKSVKTPAGD